MFGVFFPSLAEGLCDNWAVAEYIYIYASADWSHKCLVVEVFAAKFTCWIRGGSFWVKWNQSGRNKFCAWERTFPNDKLCLGQICRVQLFQGATSVRWPLFLHRALWEQLSFHFAEGRSCRRQHLVTMISKEQYRTLPCTINALWDQPLGLLIPNSKRQQEGNNVLHCTSVDKRPEMLACFCWSLTFNQMLL